MISFLPEESKSAEDFLNSTIFLHWDQYKMANPYYGLALFDKDNQLGRCWTNLHNTLKLRRPPQRTPSLSLARRSSSCRAENLTLPKYFSRCRRVFSLGRAVAPAIIHSSTRAIIISGVSSSPRGTCSVIKSLISCADLKVFGMGRSVAENKYISYDAVIHFIGFLSRKNEALWWEECDG